MAAAVGGGGLTLAGVSGVALLLAESLAARRWIEPRMPAAPAADGWYLPTPGPAWTPAASSGTQPGAAEVDDPAARATPWRLVMIGDSGAVGQGAHAASSTPGALLATRLADLTGRPVDLRVVARIGAVSADLVAQVDAVLSADTSDAHTAVPHAAVIVIGANDVKTRVAPHIAVRHLLTAVSRLVAAGVVVIVGTCPDLGTVRPIPQPLRLLARRWSHRLAAAQAIAVVESGGRAVSIGDLMRVEFGADRSAMFADDGFHPSSIGYARAVDYLMPALVGALGVDSAGAEVSQGDLPGAPGNPLAPIDLVAPVADAAVVAADHPGTQVSATSVSGRARGARGRWVRLRRGATTERQRVRAARAATE